MPREEIDFKDPRPSSRELGVEFVGRRLFGDDWIGKLSIAESVFFALLYLAEKYGRVFRASKASPISPCAASRVR
jgi:hypothetical protein